ncbi:MAG TPA: hypothetical protein VF491_13410 [Vicinamibacterales bacterium]
MTDDRVGCGAQSPGCAQGGVQETGGDGRRYFLLSGLSSATMLPKTAIIPDVRISGPGIDVPGVGVCRGFRTFNGKRVAMTARRVRFSFLLAVLVLVPCFASAATSEFRVLFDADNNPATGCTVGTMSGVDQVFVTQATNEEATAAVVRTHRLICTAGAFGEPVDVNATGWPAAIDSTNAMMTVETRVPFTAFQASGLPPTMRIGFVAVTGSAIQTLLTGPAGEC